MKQTVWSILIVASVFLVSCEKTIEEKKNQIIENRLENEASIKEIKADSLKRKAEELQNMARDLENQSRALRDSARKI